MWIATRLFSKKKKMFLDFKILSPLRSGKMESNMALGALEISRSLHLINDSQREHFQLAQ